jgi:hypothetical protein
MNAEDIRKSIAKGVKAHIVQNHNMGGWDDPDMDENIYYLEVAQVALQVKDALIPHESTEDWEADTLAQAQADRAFLVECGLSESFAKWLISDDQPSAIY